MSQKPNIITSFIRYNIVSVTATLIDFVVFLFLSELLGIWYITAAITGSVTGGVVAFVFNRNWVFLGKEGKISIQAVKYFAVWGGSIVLNTLGLFLMVEDTGLSKVLAKIIVSVIVGYGFNFLMNRYYIFNK
jgi:putative flippase GtrA